MSATLRGLTNLRIIRPLGGGLFTGAGTSPSVIPPINATTSYNVQLPIQIGDYIGIDCCALSAAARSFSWRAPPFATSGSQASPTVGPRAPPSSTTLYEVALNAEITSTFTVDAITRNKKNGTATLTVTVAHPGELTGAGKGVKVANAATSSKTVTAPGSVQLLIKAKGKKKKKLNSTGKVKVKPKITYTPTGGETVTKPVKVKLIKR